MASSAPRGKNLKKKKCRREEEKIPNNNNSYKYRFILYSIYGRRRAQSELFFLSISYSFLFWFFCFQKRKYFEYLCINNGQVDTQSHQFRSSLHNYYEICYWGGLALYYITWRVIEKLLVCSLRFLLIS